MAFLALGVRRNDNPFRYRLLFTDSGTPKNMTGYLARLQVRNYQGEPGSPLLTLNTTATSGSRISTTYGPNGEWQIIIVAADVAALPVAAPISGSPTFYYDLLVTTPSGDETAWYSGPLTVEQGVTV